MPFTKNYMKYKKMDLLDADITLFDGFTNDSAICKECYDTKKGEAKESKQQAKGKLKEVLVGLQARVPEFKERWDKNGIIQYKDEIIAILKRAVGAQVEFIIAFHDLTKEGYRLMAIDEGKEAGVGGLTGGIASYYYFQKIEFVK